MPENRRLGANSLLLSLDDGVVDMQFNIWQHLYEFGGFLGDALAVWLTGDRARSCRAAKAKRQLSRESNFWLPRVAVRGC